MAKLSEELRRLAGLARREWIAGRSWKKSSILFPVAEVFAKFGLAGQKADMDALRAATVQDIFDHLERTADDKYKPGRTKLEAIKEFVNGWYDDVLGKVYGGDLHRLLADEKLIRSAYLFYFSEAEGQSDVEAEISEE